MSVIGDALRRAEATGQAWRRPAPPPAPIVPTAPVATAPPRERKTAPSAEDMPMRRRFTASTVLLVVLTIYTLYVITRPGWGTGFLTNRSGGAAQPPPPPNQVQTGAALTPTDDVDRFPPAQAKGAPPDASTTGEQQSAANDDDTVGPPAPQGVTVTAPSLLSKLKDLFGAMSAGHRKNASSQPAIDLGESGSVQAAQPAIARQRDVLLLDKLSVDGVIITSRTRLAVVNHAIVQEGQTVDGVKIKSIERFGVTVEVDGRIYQIPIQLRPSP